MSTFEVDILNTNTIAPSDADATKTVVLDSDGATTGTNTTLDFNQTANRVITFPDADGTVVTDAQIQSGLESSVSHTTTITTTNIVFSSAFSTTPRVTASLSNASNTNATYSVLLDSVSTTDFDVIVNTSALNNFIRIVDDSMDHSSIHMVEGRPAIAYLANNTLFYVRALDSFGDSWGTVVTLDSTGLTGRLPSLSVINGNPAVSYGNNTDNSLLYIRALDSTGTSWGSPVVIENVVIANGYSSLLTVDGNPAIAYGDDTNDDLKYIRATDTTGSTWGTKVTLDSSTGGGFIITGRQINMIIANGNPAVCYYHSTNSELR